MSLKISIVGTRGIPANYGGFETYAEEISKSLEEIGHDVCVFNPHTRKVKENKISIWIYIIRVLIHYH